MFLLDFREFKIFKFQPIADIDAKGQQGDGHLGDHTAFIVFHEGVVTANVNDSTKHIDSP